MDRQTERIEEIARGDAEVIRIAAAFEDAYASPERYRGVLNALRGWLRVKMERIDAILRDPKTDDEGRKMLSHILEEHQRANAALDDSGNPFIAFHPEPGSPYLRVPPSPDDCNEDFMYDHRPSH